MDRDLVKQKVEALLVEGKRKEAVDEAIASKDFATALFLADTCDPVTSQRVKMVFAQNAFTSSSPINTVALLFSGALQASEASGASIHWGENPNELKASWKRHLAGIISNRVSGWDTVVVSLGDRLREMGEVSAAHFCYMVSGCPVGSPLEEGTRICLLGSGHSDVVSRALCTLDSLEAFDRTEAYEWVKRRGNKNATLKSFQPFKIIIAARLIDAGLMDQARAYVESLRLNSDLHTADVASYPLTLSDILHRREAQTCALQLLEKKLGLEKFVAPVAVEPPFSGLKASPFVQPVYPGHFDEDSEDMAQTDLDATFLSAKSNLLDKTGFTLTPDKSPTRPSKYISLPATKPTTIEESPIGNKGKALKSATESDALLRAAALPPISAVVDTASKAPTSSLTPQTPLMKPVEAEQPPATAMATPQQKTQRPKAAPKTAPSVLMGTRPTNSKGTPQAAPSSSGRSKFLVQRPMHRQLNILTTPFCLQRVSHSANALSSGSTLMPPKSLYRKMTKNRTTILNAKCGFFLEKTLKMLPNQSPLRPPRQLLQLQQRSHRRLLNLTHWLR